MNNKKGIGPIVAIVLLLVVAVAAIVGFQDQMFSSETFDDIEQKSADNSSSSGIKNTVISSDGGSESLSINCSDLNGGEWIKVPGNDALGTDDFCVMKYEAKEDSSEACVGGDTNNCPISQAASTPWKLISQTDAIIECQSLGDGYHLITNTEWITIARNVESVPTNWADGRIGSTVASGGGLKRGNVGIDDSASYDGAVSEYSTVRNTLALLNLTNGEGIWDLSGNLVEWTSDTIDCSGGYPCVNMPDPEGGYQELTSLTDYGSLSYDLTRPTNSNWNSEYGMGQIYTVSSAASDGGNTHAFLRGGDWSGDVSAGVFSLSLARDPSSTHVAIGFRCSYAP